MARLKLTSVTACVTGHKAAGVGSLVLVEFMATSDWFRITSTVGSAVCVCVLTCEVHESQVCFMNESKFGAC